MVSERILVAVPPPQPSPAEPPLTAEPSSTEPAAATTKPARSRRHRRDTSRVPVTIRFGLPLLAVVLLGLWLSGLLGPASDVRLQLVGLDRRPLDIAGGRYQVFPFDDDPAAPSPLPPLGEPVAFEGAELDLDADELPPAAMLRIEAEGQGIGYADVEHGQRSFVVLGPPVTVGGRVVDEEQRAVPGARVMVLAVSARGVPLAETRTGPQGEFAISSIAAGVTSWCFRVLAPRFEVKNQDWIYAPGEPVQITVRATQPVRGRVFVHGDAFDPADRELRVFRLPGVSAIVQPDGSFEIDHLPPPSQRAHLLLDVPPGFTFRRTTVAAGDTDARIDVQRAVPVHGRVVNGHTREGVVGAQVFHDHGPRGMEGARTGADGSFDLVEVPPGPVTVQAIVRVPVTSLPPERRAAVADDSVRFVEVSGILNFVAVPEHPITDCEIVVW
ncbi:MAG: carboxypeptidase regulatory-like domain-containing protein [Planctomycetes bacterium]|nr:carboxypeptidase regulatory-like domain-containing protein [Planctomycetota bacterium]